MHESIADTFTTRMAARVESLQVGPGTDERSDVGPLANVRLLEAMERLVCDAVEHGPKVLAGGRRSAGLGSGYFFDPTVLAEVTPTMDVMVDEPFGPIAPIMPFADLTEGLRLANDSPFGLAGYVFTRDLRTAHLAAEGLETGLVGVNNLVIATTEAPLGGVKESGYGRENGTEGIEAYLVRKYINMSLT